MKPLVVFIVLLLLAVPALPALAAEPEPGVTEEIIRGVTLEPVPETTVETAVPTPPPTTEPIVTETPTKPVTMPTEPVTVTETPGPRAGWLTIISTPMGAEVSIDGQAAGTTPVTGREVGAGSHQVRITMAGYEPYQTSVTVASGEQASVDASLTPVPPTVVPTTRPTEAPTTRTTVPTLPPVEPTSVPITPGPCLGCDRGWIRVHCNVDGATVSFDQLSSGCTVAGGSCDTEVVTTTLPFRSFTVQKPGYQIFTGPVTSWPAKDQTVDLYATLNPVPSSGNIQVVSHPSGAIVTLDGGSWLYTPATFSSVTSGTHYLQITMSGYQPYGTSAFVSAGQTAGVNAYLIPNSPQPQTGSINIVTSPRGADIYVDGNYYAESPYVVTGLAPGSHTLRLHKAGYDEYLTVVNVVAGSQTPISYSFATQPKTVGSIELASNPTGASVYFDGNYRGQTPYTGSLDITSILQGTHTILVRQQDYQDYTQAVYVRGGEVVTITAVLIPVAPAPQPDTTGQIIVVSTPAGAELFLDNTFRGITPVTLADIPAGSHVVTARQAGYTDASQTVTVIGGQSTPVALALGMVPVTTKTPLTAVPVMGALVIAGVFLACRRRNE
jgi:hypothetical protein